jgi:hypothetical protein
MTTAELYRLIEHGLIAEEGIDHVEALDDGVLILLMDGRELWVTAREQPA